MSRAVTPAAPAGTDAGCEACLRTGGRWVHLRRCLTCGHVGCCDSSEGRHATRHFDETGHPVMASAEPGENWQWSYPEKAYVQAAGGGPAASQACPDVCQG